MKKRLLPITILASLGVAALAGCGGGSGGGGGGGSTVDVTGVTLNKTSLELYPEGSEKLVATVAPADATDKSVTWKSGDSRICTVDAEGLVTAVAVGTAKVTVTTVDGGYKAECNVTVKLNMNSITISNKAEFADGMEAGSNKAVSVTGDPTINATDLANKGLLTIESSNKAVATTNKLMIYAVGAGTTTIIASLFGKTDSFELTVSAKQTNKEKYGTTHEGDAADPFDNEDAIKVTKALKTAGETGDDYYVKGEVASFYHAPGARDDGAVSWFLKPATEGGEKFEIYKCYKEGTGEASYLTDDDVWVNGTTIAHGKFTTYNDQCETSSAIFVSCQGNKPEPRKTVTKTFAEALSDVKALDDGADTYDYYQVDAYVTKKSGDNYFLTATKAEAITDEKANTIELYNVTDAEVVAKLTKNAKVTIVMVLKNYHEQVENLFTVAADQITVVEAGGTWDVVPEPAVADKTLAEFIALPDSKALAYNVSAEVKSFKNGSQTADKYGNMVLTDGTNDLVIYGASATATALAWNDADAYSFKNPQDFLTNGITSAIKIGDTVKMKLIRADYQGAVQGTGIVLVVTPGEGGGGGEQEVAAYKLDGTQTGGTNGYATESDIAQGGVNWKVTGNTTQNPWRIGGKSLDGVDRDIYSVNALEYDINKVVVKLGSSSLTVNSIKLMVGSTSGANDVREATNTGPLAANAVVEFVRPEGDSWIGKYFKIAINVTVEGNDNKYVQLLSVEFFGEAVA